MECEFKNIEWRVERLNSDLEDIKKDIRDIKSLLNVLEVRLDERTAKIINYLGKL